MRGVEKAALRDELVALLDAERDALESAYRATIEGATHEEARPENDKDTRALEQSYLARGQALRVEALRAAVGACARLPADASRRVAAGALVRVDDDGTERALYLAPHGGGNTLAAGTVQVVTTSSPLGAALIGREAGDVVELRRENSRREIEVLAVL